MAEEKTITVCGTAPQNPDGSYPVALWEKDAAHPDGEIFISGPAPVEVAETAAVNDALHAGTIKKTDAAPAKAPAPAGTATGTATTASK